LMTSFTMLLNPEYSGRPTDCKQRGKLIRGQRLRLQGHAKSWPNPAIPHVQFCLDRRIRPPQLAASFIRRPFHGTGPFSSRQDG
jgi:hypothetical protein